MNLTLLLTALGALFSMIQADPNISTGIKQGAIDAIESFDALMAALYSGGTLNLSAATLLTAAQGVITSLAKDPALPQDVLTYLASMDRAISAALANDALVMEQGVDPSKLHDETPLTADGQVQGDVTDATDVTDVTGAAKADVYTKRGGKKK